MAQLTKKTTRLEIIQDGASIKAIRRKGWNSADEVSDRRERRRNLLPRQHSSAQKECAGWGARKGEKDSFVEVPSQYFQEEKVRLRGDADIRILATNEKKYSRVLMIYGMPCVLKISKISR